MLRGAAGRAWRSLKLLVITVNFAIDEFRSSTVPPSRVKDWADIAQEAYMIKYDLLVYLGLIPLVAVMIFSGFVIWRTPTEADLETRKLRIADAVLVGLLALFIFTAILYFVDAEGAGAEIFNKASPVIFALVGTIVGYIFGTRTKQ
jgi:cytochrome bd-type quinol oxidase subunit 2